MTNRISRPRSVPSKGGAQHGKGRAVKHIAVKKRPPVARKPAPAVRKDKQETRVLSTVNEIREYQRRTDNLIVKTPFDVRLVRHITGKVDTDNTYRFRSDAIEARCAKGRRTSSWSAS